MAAEPGRRRVAASAGSVGVWDERGRYGIQRKAPEQGEEAARVGRAAGGWEEGDGDERRPGEAVQTGRRQCRGGAGASVEGRGLRLCRTCTDLGQPAQMADDEYMNDYAEVAGFAGFAGDGVQPPDSWEQRDGGPQAGETAHCHCHRP